MRGVDGPESGSSCTRGGGSLPMETTLSMGARGRGENAHDFTEPRRAERLLEGGRSSHGGGGTSSEPKGPGATQDLARETAEARSRRRS